MKEAPGGVLSGRGFLCHAPRERIAWGWGLGVGRVLISQTHKDQGSSKKKPRRGVLRRGLQGNRKGNRRRLTLLPKRQPTRW